MAIEICVNVYVCVRASVGLGVRGLVAASVAVLQ